VGVLSGAGFGGSVGLFLAWGSFGTAAAAFVGERQLVLIARALAADCQALILDEPFASLDLDNQRRILSLLESLAHGHDLGIIFSAHYPDHVFAIGDAVVVLARGEVPVWGPVDQVLTEGLLRQTYGVPVEILKLRQSGGRRRRAVPLV
jgi:iron complex transport system ATP-binding protein